jgi:hypothetical protein
LVSLGLIEMTAKRYRFSWEHEKSEFYPPGIFAELKDHDASKIVIMNIVNKINKESGARQLTGWVLVASHYLLLIILLIIYCFIESAAQNNMTGFILFAVPFLSFIPIVYAMVRDKPLVKITKYMKKNEPNFNKELSNEKYHLTSLFISGHNLKGKQFSFFESVFLGRDFSGFLEFEDRHYLTDPDAPVLGNRSQLIEKGADFNGKETSNWELQNLNTHQKFGTSTQNNTGSNKHSLVHPSNNQQYITDHPFNENWTKNNRPSSAASNNKPAERQQSEVIWDPTVNTKRPQSPSGPRPHLVQIPPLSGNIIGSERPLNGSSTDREGGDEKRIHKHVVLWDPTNPNYQTN